MDIDQIRREQAGNLPGWKALAAADAVAEPFVCRIDCPDCDGHGKEPNRIRAHQLVKGESCDQCGGLGRLYYVRHGNEWQPSHRKWFCALVRSKDNRCTATEAGLRPGWWQAFHRDAGCGWRLVVEIPE